MVFTLWAVAGQVSNLPVEEAGGYQPHQHAVTPGDLSFQHTTRFLAWREAGSPVSRQW